MTPEYTHLFNETSQVIRALQDTLLIQVCTSAYAKETAKTDPAQALEYLLEQCKQEMAALQKMQNFLVSAQQKAEEIYMERTD